MESHLAGALVEDVRFGLRMLRKNPGSLRLQCSRCVGIGANAPSFP